MAKIVIKSKGAVHKMITARRSNDIDRRPGSLQPDLVNRIPDVLAREFSRVGEDLYDKTMSEITESVKRNFGEGIQTLQSTVTEETGRQGFEKSKRFIHDWLRGIVSDLQIKGVPGLADSLGNLASEFSVQYRESPGEEGETTDEGEALLEVEAPKPAATPSKEEPEKEKAEEVTDEDLTAILEGKEAGGGEAKVETAAGTLGEFKRTLRATRKHRRVEAAGRTREDLLKAAAVHLKTLEA
jgi:hypothetical protein